MKTMKHFFKISCAAAIITAGTIALSSFTKDAQTESLVAEGYSIVLLDKTTDGTNETWTWALTNPNPGNGENGTYQDVSHASMPLTAAAEAALVSAEYSYDQVSWTSVSIEMERDPSIRVCTSTDVLKFNVGTTGTEPLYMRVTFSDEFNSSLLARCYIKTGGGRTGCNWYYFEGIGNQKLD